MSRNGTPIDGVSAKQVDRLKPWVAANYLGPFSPEPARREAGMIFFDHLLQYIAAERGARVFALETPKDQLDAFDGMPMRLQVDMLRHALRRSGRGKREFERMVELYLKSDVEAILGLAEQQQKVLNLYYYEELTLKEIGAVLEVSESRVCQIHGAALKALRNVVNAAD